MSANKTLPHTGLEGQEPVIREFLKRHTSSALRASLRNLKDEVEILLKHRRGSRLASRYRDNRHLRLHLGCGNKIKKGWINLDLCSGADLPLDLREPLPFADGTCELIYSEHFLEHIDYPEPVGNLLRESYRVLEHGGRFSAGVPDTEWPMEEYMGLRAEGYFQTASERWHPAWCQTEMEHINYHFRQGGEHKFAYDFETLAAALTRAGFEDVRRRQFDIELDSADWKLGTLYVDGYKQGRADTPHK